MLILRLAGEVTRPWWAGEVLVVGEKRFGGWEFSECRLKSRCVVAGDSAGRPVSEGNDLRTNRFENVLNELSV